MTTHSSTRQVEIQRPISAPSILEYLYAWEQAGPQGGEEVPSEKLILILDCFSLWPLNIVLKSSFCHFEEISLVNQFPRN